MACKVRLGVISLELGDHLGAFLSLPLSKFRRLIRWISLLLRQILATLFACPSSNPAIQPESRDLHGRRINRTYVGPKGAAPLSKSVPNELCNVGPVRRP